MKTIFSMAAFALAASVVMMPSAYAQFGGGSGRHGSSGKGCDREATREGSKDADAVAASGVVSFERLDYQLNTLQVDMRLTPEQSTAWDSFASKVRAVQADAARERSRGVSAIGANSAGFGSMRAIGASVDRARNRMTALEELEMSAKALYELLQADQKAQADVRLVPILSHLLRG